MDEVPEMMEGLTVNDCSVYEYVDPEFEFDACKFFDFTVDETSYDVRETERWFRYAREYPPAPYMMKINLVNVLKSIPVKVHPISSPNLEAGKQASPSITHSDCSMPSSEVITEDGSSVKYHNLFSDDTTKAKSKSAFKSCKPNSPSFMKPTASHLAKQGSYGRLYTGCEIEDIKRQKLETGYLRKVARLNHPTSLLHKTATKVAYSETSSSSLSKTTIPQKPKLRTEERARWRRRPSKSEAINSHTFKALPLNRKILESRSPLLPVFKKSTPQSPEFQNFRFKETTRPMQHESTSVPNNDGDVSIPRHRHNLLPIDFFMKLSLKSDHFEKKRIYPVNPRLASKASKEKAHT